MLRQDFVQGIRSSLGNLGFRAEDLSLEEKLSADKTWVILSIIYAFEPQYRFSASISANSDFSGSSEKGGRIIVEVSPGTLLRNERLRYDLPTELQKAVDSWIVRLERELKTIPVNRAIAENQAEIERLADQISRLPDDYFSREEAEVLRSRLDGLEKRLSENIRGQSESKRDADEKISRLHSDIAMLKERADALKRQGWAKAFLIRMAVWAKDPANRELLGAGIDITKQLLLPPGEPSAK